MKKRILSFAMALAMVVSILPLPALAAEGCANHPAHDASCGYVAAVEGQACGHQHSDACRVETVNCTHVHTAECYPEGNMEGEPALCAHVCSVESGCVTVSCNHVHNEECGYVEAVAGQPCKHSCELCNPPEEPEEKIVCICDTRCNEMVNTDCPVCAVDASQCAVTQAHEIPQAVLDVQAMIDALPGLEAVRTITDADSWYAAYDKAYAAYEAYLELSEEEMAMVDASLAEALLTWFKDNQIELLPNSGNYDVSKGNVVIDDSCGGSCSGHTITGSTKQYNVAVTGSHTIILSSVTIDVSLKQGTSPVDLDKAGACTITLTGDNILKAGNNHPGIFVPNGNCITFNGSGTLDVTGGRSWPGIGRNGNGNIRITSGNITSRGGNEAAGIGGSNGFAGGHIEILGGNVTATRGEGCNTDIGNGWYGSGYTEVTIGANATIKNEYGEFPSIEGGKISIEVSSVTLNKTETAISVGTTETLTATVNPEQATVDKTVSWETSDATVATVDNTGKVTAVGGGTATITAKAGTKSASCTVTVKVPVTGVALDKTSATIVIGSTLQLTATVSPENATNQRVTWGSNNRGVATVDSNGLVTAVSEGEASIILTTADGGKSASCKVTVLAPVTYLDANGNQQTCTDYTPVTEDMTSLGKAGETTWYVVDRDVTMCDLEGQYRLTYGNVHLILKDGCKMDNGDLGVYSGSLTIYGQSTGASMGKYSRDDEVRVLSVVAGGSLTINGGFIDTKGSTQTPGIGVYSGTLTINGGIVKASGGSTFVPAIGGDQNGHIRIYGGEVIAECNGSNDIGADFNKTYAEIYISGNAKVTDGKGQFPGVSDATSRFIGVRSITLPSTLTLGVDGSETLTPTMFPAVATDISWTSDNESVATVDASGRVTAVSAGTANITVTGQVEKNGAVKTATCAVTVNKLDSNLPLTVNQNGVFTYGDTITVEFTPTVKAATRLAAPAIKEAALFLGTTQLTEAVTADASGKFTLTYNTADKGLSIGENKLTVHYGGSDKLNAGTADVTVTLNPKPVTVSGVAAVSRDYAPGSTTVTLDLTNAAVVGKVGADEVAVSGGTGTMADANAGVNKAVTVTGLTLSGTHAGFYSLTAQPTDVTVTITPKEVTAPTVTVTPDSYVYTGSPITPTSVVVKDGETVIPDTEYTVAYANNTNVGTATVTITDNEGGNYAVSGSGAFAITQSGTAMTLTTDKDTYVYGETITATVTVTATGMPKLRTAPTANQVAIFNGTEQLTEPQTVTDGEALTFTFNSSALGAGNATLTAQYIESGNMAGQTATASVTVTPKPLTVTLTGTTTKVYDGTIACDGTGLTLTVEGVLDGDTVTHTVTYTYDDANVGDRTVTANITLGGADAGNYKLPEEALTAAGSITAKAVTITVDNKNATEGDPIPTLTYTISGLLGNDKLVKEPTLACNADMSKPGEYTITASGADAGSNYEINYVPGKLTVEARSIFTVTFDSYGGSIVAAQTVKCGDEVIKPADPTLAKHNFKGWYTDKECTKAYDFDTPVTGNLTLHAKWAEVYTFTLNYKANTSATVRNMPKDESVTSERNEMTFRLSYSKPKRSGYTFTGWNTQSNGKGKKYQPGDDVPGIKDGTVTLYAQWKQNSGSWWDNPKTGDYIMIAVAVLAVSGIALAGLLVYSKKKKK